MASPRLGANGMFDWAFHNIAENTSQEPNAKVTDIHSAKGYGAKFSFSDQNLYLLNPSSDADDIGINNVGTRPLPETFTWINDLKKQDNNATFVIPFAQCKGRQHWTLLIIKNNSTYFYDPKGAPFLFMAYNLNPLNSYLKSNNLPQIDANTTRYTNLQGLVDSVHCGYFVGNIIQNLIPKILRAEPLANTAFPTIEPEELISQFKSIALDERPEYANFLKAEVKEKRNQAPPELPEGSNSYLNSDNEEDEFDMAAPAHSRPASQPTPRMYHEEQNKESNLEAELKSELTIIKDKLRQVHQEKEKIIATKEHEEKQYQEIIQSTQAQTAKLQADLQTAKVKIKNIEGAVDQLKTQHSVTLQESQQETQRFSSILQTKTAEWDAEKIRIAQAAAEQQRIQGAALEQQAKQHASQMQLKNQELQQYKQQTEQQTIQIQSKNQELQQQKQQAATAIQQLKDQHAIEIEAIKHNDIELPKIKKTSFLKRNALKIILGAIVVAAIAVTCVVTFGSVAALSAIGVAIASGFNSTISAAGAIALGSSAVITGGLIVGATSVILGQKIVDSCSTEASEKIEKDVYSSLPDDEPAIAGSDRQIHRSMNHLNQRHVAPVPASPSTRQPSPVFDGAMIELAEPEARNGSPSLHNRVN